MTLRLTDDADDHTGIVVAAFACGALVGAALGLMFAPTRGDETRVWLAAQSRTAGRGMAPLLHPQEAMAVVRASGVRGLLDVMARAAYTSDGAGPALRPRRHGDDGQIVPN